jgi:septal ring factor EnvC (AmiA/AmiB activator)
MLMAWQIQQRYLTNHFKDDPALTGVLVRRILMQGQDQSVKKKMAKIETLEAKVNENKNHATSEIGKVKAELVKVKDELSKLAKK